MKRIHLYPFAPVASHGGTLRLRTALDAGSNAEQTLWWFDRSRDVWRVASANDLACRASSDSPARLHASLKRRIFPSTLWESGLKARRRSAEVLWRIGSAAADSQVVLHTSYLAPLAARLGDRGVDVVVDVYDLVGRAHKLDAAAGTRLAAAPRAAYAATVTAREQRSLRHAARVVTAGYTDHETLCHAGIESAWAPTGIPAVRNVDPPPLANGLRVGFLGNFSHSPTADSAARLARSPIARADEVTVVLAGYGSESTRLAWIGRAEILGRVDAPEDFYAQVHCVVLPVATGAGMKVKLAEAVLAGRPALTTPIGAAGFPPELHAHLIIAATEADLTESLCRSALQRHAAVEARRAFERVFGWHAATARYRAAMGGST